MLRLRDLSYVAPSGRVLDRIDLDLDVTKGSVTLFLGAPGSGAMTLARVLAGEIAPTTGTISGDERPYAVVTERAVAAPGRGRDVACRIIRACAALAQRGASAIAGLHEIDLATAFADRVVLMSAGQVVAEGAPSIVLERSLVRCVFTARCARARPLRLV